MHSKKKLTFKISNSVRTSFVLVSFIFSLISFWRSSSFASLLVFLLIFGRTKQINYQNYRKQQSAPPMCSIAITSSAYQGASKQQLCCMLFDCLLHSSLLFFFSFYSFLANKGQFLREMAIDNNTDCLGCRLVSGTGMIGKLLILLSQACDGTVLWNIILIGTGAGTYILFQAKKTDHKWGKLAMQAISLGMFEI